MKFIDANLILRYLLEEPKANLVEKLLERKEKLYLADMVVAEVIWTLISFYKRKKGEFIEALEAFIALEFVNADKKLLGTAIEIYKKFNVDYINAYLTALMQKKNVKILYSFDRDFDKIPGIRRLEPK